MACFQRYDVLLGPQLGVPGIPIGTRTEIELDGTRVPFISTIGYTVLPNGTGNPALSLPTGLDGGLPIGVQLIGRMWDEPTLFALARPLLDALGGVRLPPEGL